MNKIICAALLSVINLSASAACVDAEESVIVANQYLSAIEQDRLLDTFVPKIIAPGKLWATGVVTRNGNGSPYDLWAKIEGTKTATCDPLVTTCNDKSRLAQKLAFASSFEIGGWQVDRVTLHYSYKICK